MDPLADSYERRLYTRVLLWVQVFFCSTTLASISIQILSIPEYGILPTILELRLIILLVNVLGLILITTRSDSIKLISYLPHFIIGTNLSMSAVIGTLSYQGPIIASASVILSTILYVFCLGFFVKSTLPLLLVGGFQLALGLLMGSLGPRFTLTSGTNGTDDIHAMGIIMIYGIALATILIALHNKLQRILLKNAHEANERLTNLAYVDQYTGLPNSLKLESVIRALDDYSVTSVQGTQELAMVGFRLMGLDTMNERHGIEATNKMVGRIAKQYNLILSQLGSQGPPMDLPVGIHQLYRVESNIFMFFLPQSIKGWEIDYTGQGLGRILESIRHEGKEPWVIQFAGGFTNLPDDGNSTAILYRNLLTMLYGSKPENLGTFTGFDSSKYLATIRNNTILEELSQAITNQDIAVVYQKKVMADTGKTIGFEALARFTSPTLGPISPLEFIGIAEKNSLILSLTKVVFSKVFTFIHGAKLRGNHDLHVAVNVSPGLMVPDFFAWLQSRVLEEKLGPEIELEITESIVMNVTEVLGPHLLSLQKLGIEFAIDDFGTGYSNLGYLQKFHAQTLKIDKRFIDELPHNETNAKIVRAILQMAQSFEMTVVAEGVEYQEQRNFLVDHGCQIIQGYLYGKPMDGVQMLDSLGREP